MQFNLYFLLSGFLRSSSFAYSSVFTVKSPFVARKASLYVPPSASWFPFRLRGSEAILSPGKLLPFAACNTSLPFCFLPGTQQPSERFTSPLCRGEHWSSQRGTRGGVRLWACLQSPHSHQSHAHGTDHTGPCLSCRVCFAGIFLGTLASVAKREVAGLWASQNHFPTLVFKLPHGSGCRSVPLKSYEASVIEFGLS